MTATERHYSTSEVAEMWGLNVRLIQRMFRDEPGVLKIGSPRLRTKRSYETLRIPESVLRRWHEQRSGGFVVERRGR